MYIILLVVIIISPLYAYRNPKQTCRMTMIRFMSTDHSGDIVSIN